MMGDGDQEEDPAGGGNDSTATTAPPFAPNAQNSNGHFFEGEPERKKYAKESWPGKKRVLLNPSSNFYNY
jgi:hypothetical protein